MEDDDDEDSGKSFRPDPGGVISISESEKSKNNSQKFDLKLQIGGDDRILGRICSVNLCGDVLPPPCNFSPGKADFNITLPLYPENKFTLSDSTSTNFQNLSYLGQDCTNDQLRKSGDHVFIPKTNLCSKFASSEKSQNSNKDGGNFSLKEFESPSLQFESHHKSFDTFRPPLVQCLSLDDSTLINASDDSSHKCYCLSESCKGRDVHKTDSNERSHSRVLSNISPAQSANLKNVSQPTLASSQLSLDSGILSALSGDLGDQNCSEICKNIRTMSSVSSGTSEMGHVSLDEEFLSDRKASSSTGDDSSRLKLSPINRNSYLSNLLRDSTEACYSSSEEFETGENNICTIKPNYQVMQAVRNDRKIKVTESGEIKFEDEGNICNESPIDIPLNLIENFALSVAIQIVEESLEYSITLNSNMVKQRQLGEQLFEAYTIKNKTKQNHSLDRRKNNSPSVFPSSSSKMFCSPEIPFSPSHRSHSRASKGSTLSFSHDSLASAIPTHDDSLFITNAISHEALSFPVGLSKVAKNKGISKVKIKQRLREREADLYSHPIDRVKEPFSGEILHPKPIIQQPRKFDRGCANRKDIMPTINDCYLLGKGDEGLCNKIDRNSYQVAEGNVSSHKSIFDDGSKLSNGAGAVAVSNYNCIISETNPKMSPARKFKERQETSRLCRIIPFTIIRSSNKRKDTRLCSKKNRSLSSNIRNTLVALFSFRKPHAKNLGNSINATNEFIDSSSKEFLESCNGLRWGKICPLPSAPTLRPSLKTSTFTDEVIVLEKSRTTEENSHCLNDVIAHDNNNHNLKILPAACAKPPSSQCIEKNPPTSYPQRHSSSISPSSLLSCLGGNTRRSNSFDSQSLLPLSDSSGTEAQTIISSDVSNRALPPLPTGGEGCDFASIIEKVKDYGWYWGPISGEAAEKILSNEPNGSFIVRDSSDHHYIFSLTFRLNGVMRHVRIEHDQGNFSFGGFTRFKSHTIVDFIEKAVEHSRSGRYLFFLHRRPILGPMRVQLLHPVSRFKHVQSLQHICRFIIVKQVRRKDLIGDLPLPQRLKDYLSSPHYYSEQVEEQCTTTLPRPGSSSYSSKDGMPTPKITRTINKHPRWRAAIPRRRSSFKRRRPHGSASKEGRDSILVGELGVGECGKSTNKSSLIREDLASHSFLSSMSKHKNLNRRNLRDFRLYSSQYSIDTLNQQAISLPLTSVCPSNQGSPVDSSTSSSSLQSLISNLRSGEHSEKKAKNSKWTIHCSSHKNFRRHSTENNMISSFESSHSSPTSPLLLDFSQTSLSSLEDRASVRNMKTQRKLAQEEFEDLFNFESLSNVKTKTSKKASEGNKMHSNHHRHGS